MKRAAGERGLVVVGASLSGLRAVQAARREQYSGRIVLIGRESGLPYDRPPLSKAFLTDDEPSTPFYVTEEHLMELDIELHLGKAATSVDLVSRSVNVGDLAIPYDKLIVATGADPRSLGVGSTPLGVETLRTIDDARRVRQALRDARNVVVVGAGFIGSEVASSAKSLGARVTIVEAAKAPLARALGEIVGEAVSDLHRRNDVRLLRSTHVVDVVGVDRVTGLTLSTGERVAADLVVVGVGAVPATRWLAESGLALHPGDSGVLCDDHLRSSDEHVYAAGDVVHWPNEVLDTTMRLENWTAATAQGTRAAVNALFPDRAKPFVTVPYFWSDWYGHRLQFVGTAAAQSVSFVDGSPDGDRFVALYRSGNRVIGAATLNEPHKIMKLRRLIAARGTWDEAVALLAPMVGSSR